LIFSTKRGTEAMQRSSETIGAIAGAGEGSGGAYQSREVAHCDH
jgi:hypothetical protein